MPNKGPEPDGSDLVSVTELTGGIAIVAMIDSSHHNMFTTALLARLEHEFACIASRDDVRVVILTGTERTFSMGATPKPLNSWLVRNRPSPQRPSYSRAYSAVRYRSSRPYAATPLAEGSHLPYMPT